MLRKALILTSLSLAIACGGKVTVTESSGGAGGGGTGNSGTGNSGNSGSGNSGTGNSGNAGTGNSGVGGNSVLCPAADCPDGEVCIFATNECADVCSNFEPCGPGEVCDFCATGSCPGCEDCVAACVPANLGQCDDHDDCEDDEVCLFGSQECAPNCESDKCADPNLVCDFCATSSCPACQDCLAACLPIPPG